MSTIYKAKRADIPTIQALADCVYQAQYPDESQRARFLERVYSERSLIRAIDSTSAMFVVASDGTRLVGMCHFGSPLLEECANRKEIHRLYVHPDYTRQGIGGDFVRYIRQHYALHDEVENLFVYVPSDDTIRQQFYRKQGFRHEPINDQDGNRYYVTTL